MYNNYIIHTGNVCTIMYAQQHVLSTTNMISVQVVATHVFGSSVVG